MTQTASFNEKLKTAYSFFKWELKACSGTLVIYTILSAVFTTIAFTLCVVSLNQISSSNHFDDAIKFFQLSSSNIIYILTTIFTIIYTIRVYSYLHNKRKADLYGALPVSRITLFLSKSATAFIFSIVPALFFLGIISVVTICCGQPILAEVSSMYIQIIMGSLACISAYGLLAVCCGTTINAVMMFIVVCVAYPLSAIFIKGIVGGFYVGFYSGILHENFIMNALNPLDAYNGTNIIYWLLFTIACTVGACFLAKRRKQEKAQSSFAYYLPCHIIKVLIAFLIGMFLGLLFGSLNVLGYGLAGFFFGFILGSIPAFIISHLIFYRGFKKLIKTSIPLLGLIIVVVATITICNFDVFGYNNRVPSLDEVKSAGFIDLDYCYNNDSSNFKKLSNKCCDDFTDKDSIELITSLHSDRISNIKNIPSNKKFTNVWYSILNDAFSFSQPKYFFGYTLNNGMTIKRVYTENPYNYYNNSYDQFTTPTSLIYSEEYFENYGAVYNANKKNITDLVIGTDDYYSSYVLTEQIQDNKQQALSDALKIAEAFRKDYDNDTTTREAVLAPISYRGDVTLSTFEDICSDAVCLLSISVSTNSYDDTDSLSSFILRSAYNEKDVQRVLIPKSYTNTINALKETGVLNDNLELNEDSDYYKGYSYYTSEYEYNY